MSEPQPDLEAYKAEIVRLRQLLQNAEAPKFESADIGELCGALSKAQGEMKLAIAEKSSHYGKYADLGIVIKTVREPLSKHGLSVIQRVTYDAHGHLLLTRLCHQSGQWIEGRMRLTPGRQDIQSMGSYITYVRRYCFASIVGIAGGDDDDDGLSSLSDEDLLQKQREAGVVKRLTRAQAQQISDLLVELPDDLQARVMDGLSKKYGVDRIGDLPDTAVKEVISGIEKLRKSVGLV